MATDPNKPSFSPRRRWSIGFNVGLAIVAVFALVVMVNYLNARHFTKRFFLSSNTRMELSPRTISLLRSMTNEVRVTLYYDKDEDLYGDVSQLLTEYQSANPKIQIKVVDYLRDPGAALEIKAKYNLGSSTNKNFVIFDCEGRSKIVDEKILMRTQLERVEGEERVYRRKPVAFHGEMMFTGALLSVINPNPLKAYYLEGHGEASLTDAGEMGYQTFAGMLRQNYIDVNSLSLLGTNLVPDDANLLIIAGPGAAIPDFELEKINQYLSQGGRLFALFDARSAAKEVGLEGILLKYGVVVGLDLVVDPEHMATGKDLVVSAYSLHPAMNPVVGSGLYMVVPRPISKDRSADLSEMPVEEIAFTSENAYLYSDKEKTPGRFALIAAVDEGAKGLIRERGATRMLVVGDSFLLNNRQIEMLANRDFLNGAISWLCDRNYLLEGVGPKNVTEFRLVIPKGRLQALQWILLGAVPGGILLFGGLIWLTRRK
jgi:hypothetical protein